MNNKLFELRKSKKLSRSRLIKEVYVFDKTDISEQSLKSWEDNRTSPSSKHLRSIAAYFGKTMDYFYD